MIIQLKKFGTTLISRQSGREAYAAFLPSLKNISPDENIEIDFAGVNTFSPSWADEFLTPLAKEYKAKLRLKKSDNLSVISTIKLLGRINGDKYVIIG
ncbi:STAS-like domain-containing protein [Patescibacteria group bacterium]|nr:STAS-like domain-containing protein [Patescibacteria group bacterium]